MTIKAINIAMGASYGAYSQKLTQTTKKKLDELGIPYNNNMSEEEGKKLISIKESQKTPQENIGQNGASSSDLFKRARKLAEKLGIQVQEGTNLQQLIKVIEMVLEQKISAAYNNPAELKELRELSRELANIQAESNGSSGYDNTNQALMMSLELMSEYNKNFLYR